MLEKKSDSIKLFWIQIKFHNSIRIQMDFQGIEVLGISIEKDQITKEIHSSI